MLVKVCGMREAENIRAVEQTGVDWIGFIFYPHSPRFVSSCPAYLPVRAKRIGVFVNERADEIVRKARLFGLHGIQLHGNESPACCQELLQRLRQDGSEAFLIKAFSICKEQDLQQTDAYAPYCAYFLFDTPCSGYGGSGQSFRWELLASYRGSTPFLLSGGISYTCLPALRQFRHPQWTGIDLNSCFESRPGYKETMLLQSFLDELKKQTHHEQNQSVIS